MDRVLADRLNSLNEQNEKLKRAEGNFRQLEAHKDVLWAQLYLRAEGKNVAEREAVVAASDDWRNYVTGLSNAETEYNYERRRFEILSQAYIAELNTYKQEAGVIRKQG